MRTYESIKKVFSELKNWEDKYKFIIDLGKEIPVMDNALKSEENKIKGCQSQVWLSAELTDGLLVFHADSDASIVKGIVGILLSIYSARCPKDILSQDHGFIDELELKQHLSLSRTNGLAAMLKQIQHYAFAYQTKINLGI